VTPQQPFLIPSIIMLVVAIPLALGLVPPNRVYGVRTRKTLSDPEIWRRANSFGGCALGLASLISIFAGRYVPYPPAHSADVAALVVHLAVCFGPVLLALALTGLYIRRL